MQHVNRIRHRRDIDDAKRAGNVAYPDFPHAGPNGFHRLPIAWILAPLHREEFISGIPTGAFGKLPQPRERVAEKFDGLPRGRSVHRADYIRLDKIGKDLPCGFAVVKAWIYRKFGRRASAVLGETGGADARPARRFQNAVDGARCAMLQLRHERCPLLLRLHLLLPNGQTWCTLTPEGRI